MKEEPKKKALVTIRIGDRDEDCIEVDIPEGSPGQKQPLTGKPLEIAKPSVVVDRSAIDAFLKKAAEQEPPPFDLKSQLTRELENELNAEDQKTEPPDEGQEIKSPIDDQDPLGMGKEADFPEDESRDFVLNLAELGLDEQDAETVYVITANRVEENLLTGLDDSFTLAEADLNAFLELAEAAPIAPEPPRQSVTDRVKADMAEREAKSKKDIARLQQKRRAGAERRAEAAEAEDQLRLQGVEKKAATEAEKPKVRIIEDIDKLERYLGVADLVASRKGDVYTKRRKRRDYLQGLRDSATSGARSIINNPLGNKNKFSKRNRESEILFRALADDGGVKIPYASISDEYKLVVEEGYVLVGEGVAIPHMLFKKIVRAYAEAIAQEKILKVTNFVKELHRKIGRE